MHFFPFCVRQKARYPTVFLVSVARDRQSDSGAPAGPMLHLTKMRGVRAGCRPRVKRGGTPKQKKGHRYDDLSCSSWDSNPGPHP